MFVYMCDRCGATRQLARRRRRALCSWSGCCGVAYLVGTASCVDGDEEVTR